MIKPIDRKATRQKRHRRVRKNIYGSTERPRLAVFRSNKHVYAQMIDDLNGHTIASAATTEADLKDSKMTSKEAAEKIGERIAERSQEKGIKAAVLDRGGFLYHGNIKALTDAARKKGLRI